MTSTRHWVVAAVAVVAALACASLSACASGPVQRGALIGALAGAAAGTGAGFLISDDSLLGSRKQSKIELQTGSAVGAGALIGTVFGAIVGAMIGHGNEDTFPPPPAASHPAATAGADADGVRAQAEGLRSAF